ncbi:hypothetical protein lerEdw1_018393, partial [Lerista edwardsae]
MMAMGPFSCLVLISFLFGKTVTTESRAINFGKCELSRVSLRELRDYFGVVREIVVSSSWRSMFVIDLRMGLASSLNLPDTMILLMKEIMMKIALSSGTHHQTQDNQTDVILLNRTVLQEIPVLESCCLFRHILRFYTERVFKHYQPTSNLLRRKTSTLANYFLSIKTSLKKC